MNTIYKCEPGITNDDVAKYGALSADVAGEEPIDMVLFNNYANAKDLAARYKKIKWVPFNPTDKFTAITLMDQETGRVFRLLKGSPQVRRPWLWGRCGNQDAVWRCRGRARRACELQSGDNAGAGGM